MSETFLVLTDALSASGLVEGVQVEEMLGARDILAFRVCVDKDAKGCICPYGDDGLYAKWVEGSGITALYSESRRAPTDVTWGGEGCCGGKKRKIETKKRWCLN